MNHVIPPYTARSFRYQDYRLDADAGTVTCHYRLDDHTFTEVFTFDRGGDWSRPAVAEMARLLFLLAGVSYYKAGAPPVIDTGRHGLTDAERIFLREFYLDGLGEFAVRQQPPIDLSGLRIRGPRLVRERPVGYDDGPARPLIPFGGGVDSIVTTELIRPATADAALFVVNRPGDRFAAIETPAATTGLPVVRAERLLDPQILRSRELGFRNGHVPVTGIISAIGLVAAALAGRDALVMSNEWSASVGTVVVDGRQINHQYSKSLAFETGLRAWIAAAVGPGLEYFSLLRPFTELWIARSFAALPQYLDTFRSCNRSFHIDPARRLDRWCGVCDKCAFVDLISAPFVPASALRRVFAAGTTGTAGAGVEPLENPAMLPALQNLVGLVPDAKPWECVGDVHESAVAALLAAARADRSDSPVLAELARRIRAAGLGGGAADPAGTGTIVIPGVDDATAAAAATLLRPAGTHHIPDRYLPATLRGADG